jgi:cytochrome P450
MATNVVTATETIDGWAGFDGPLGDDPYPLYAQVRAEAPVRPVVLADGRPAWIVTGYDEARQALVDPRLAKAVRTAVAARPELVPPGLTHPLFGNNLLFADGADHGRLRRLIGGAFSPGRVAALRPRVQAVVDRLLDDLEAAAGADRTAPVDLLAGFALPLPIIVIFELLGVPLADQERLRAWFTAIFANPVAPASDPPGLAAAVETYTYLVGLIAAKRAAPADDLLSALAASVDGDGLTEAELLSTAWLLVVAGHETTVNLIGNGVVALLRHPDQLARLRGDLMAVPRAVEEFLRYDGPVQHATFRMTTEPVVIGDVEIPAHEQVVVAIAAANRDPGRFAEADTFRVDRDDNRHVAFGHGPHFCLGAALARLEGEVAFTSLLTRFPHLRPAVPVDQFHWTYRLILRSLDALPVFLR